MKTYNAIIIDNEKTERIKLRNLITEFCISIHIEGEFDSLSDAQVMFEDDKPTIAFVALNNGGWSSFDLLRKINIKNLKILFLITDEHQVLEALNFNPIDFLLKPIEITKLIIAINKSIRQIEFESNNKLETDYKKLGVNSEDHRNFVAVPSLDKIDIIRLDELIFCMADGKYTNFYLKSGTKVLSSKNLGEYESLLSNNQFFRIHHSYMVNLSHVVKVDKRDGSYCVLSNGITIPIAKRRQDSFNKYILSRQ
jgi:two-component system, LytTR family, response regulator